jgi:hypothetical protein
MSFIVGDEIVTAEIPIEVEPILKRLKDNTREKSIGLMNTIANSDKFMAYVIPEAGMVFFADELTDEHKIFRFLISNNGDLYIDNKQRRGEMFCPMFDVLEKQISKITGKEAETVADDKEYKRYDKFMPKIVDTINQILTTKPDMFKH